jgi:succinate-semialdehyde dehydrogenase / glutarate-semialdehyde dehydrogenase
MKLVPTRQDLLRTQNFIGGKWLNARSGQRLAVLDPATNAQFADVPDSGPNDARDAVDAAAGAFTTWRRCNARERANLLKRWHANILAAAEDLACIISHEQGKPLAEARGEVSYGASYVEWFAEEAVRSNGELLPALVPNKKMMVTREPVGVVAAITPWNFPLAMLARKIAPALAAGCTVVAKPAEDTPLTALALIKLLEEADCPAGVVNIISASREQTIPAVLAWLKDARVRKLTFTGSTAVGKYLARESADNLKRLSLELGGNAPFIVFADADVDAAVEGLMRAKFRNGGQACVSPNRVFVQDSILDAFTQRLVQRVASLVVGPATDSAAQIGPMINTRAVDKIDRHVQDALTHGAKLLVGGKRLRTAAADGPNYYAPTVLTNCSPSMALSCEETFGPVVPLFAFHSETEVVHAANDTPYGLAAYFYSRDLQRIWRVAEQLECGIVGINEGTTSSEAVPFGGVKESGYGREGSKHGLDDYTQLKYLCYGELT